VWSWSVRQLMNPLWRVRKAKVGVFSRAESEEVFMLSFFGVREGGERTIRGKSLCLNLPPRLDDSCPKHGTLIWIAVPVPATGLGQQYEANEFGVGPGACKCFKYGDLRSLHLYPPLAEPG
jgi:hypothetical protein